MKKILLQKQKTDNLTLQETGKNILKHLSGLPISRVYGTISITIQNGIPHNLKVEESILAKDINT